MGGVALFGMLAYLFTPLSAAGAEGAPEGFGINIRYAIPALLAGLTLLPLALRLVDAGRQWAPARWSRAACPGLCSSPTAPTPSCATPTGSSAG